MQQAGKGAFNTTFNIRLRNMPDQATGAAGRMGRTLIEAISAAITLEPGDVIVMGTPAGVGYARKPPVWMQAGDTIEIEIEGIGVLRNAVGLLTS